VVPTVLAALGLAASGHRCEGRSLLPLLRGEANLAWRDSAVAELDYSFRRARVTLGRRAGQCQGWMVRTAQWKYIHWQGFRPQLFDLVADSQELLDLGLLTTRQIRRQDPDHPAFKKYFMHGVGHPIGLDVHDVGFTTEPMKPGWVMTVEPAIYLREEGFAVRLENTVLVGEHQNVDLMADIPIETAEIARINCTGVIATAPCPMPTEIVSPANHFCLKLRIFHSSEGITPLTSLGRSIPVFCPNPSMVAYLAMRSIPSFSASV